VQISCGYIEPVDADGCQKVGNTIHSKQYIHIYIYSIEAQINRKTHFSKVLALHFSWNFLGIFLEFSWNFLDQENSKKNLVFIVKTDVFEKSENFLGIFLARKLPIMCFFLEFSRRENSRFHCKN